MIYSSAAGNEQWIEETYPAQELTPWLIDPWEVPSQSMILEGIVTTVSPTGAVNIAPMGPRVEPDMRRFVLRPFPDTDTYRNLREHPEGVLHVTDDVLLLAQAALGELETQPQLLPAHKVRGYFLADACRCYEFRIVNVDDSGERILMEAEVLHTERLRDFFGFNRARHAVIEAAILATRTSFLPLADIETEYAKLRIIVDKTGGEQEREAFSFLENYLALVARRRAEEKQDLL